jgi:hypothetical protein
VLAGRFIDGGGGGTADEICAGIGRLLVECGVPATGADRALCAPGAEHETSAKHTEAIAARDAVNFIVYPLELS